MKLGSLFSGAGGLDLAVEAVFGATTVWQCEQDKAAAKVLAYRWPNVLNLGDITAVDWNAVEPVDILCGGFPCQDVSPAGARAGLKDGTRSGLWSYMADAIDALRPRYIVIENVRGLLSATAHRAVESGDSVVGDRSDRPVLRAIGAVVGDLADLGYVGGYTVVSAASVGAPHRRERVFILAADAGYRDESERAWEAGRQAGQRQPVGDVARRDSDDAVALLPTPAARDFKGSDTAGDHNRHSPGMDAVTYHFPALAAGQEFPGPVGWGNYEPAIRRWERVLGRPAPAPNEPNKNGNPRLAAEFSSWLMGWPAGWVTEPDIGISRNDQLRIVGNGVCCQQAIAALRYLLSVTKELEFA